MTRIFSDYSGERFNGKSTASVSKLNPIDEEVPDAATQISGLKFHMAESRSSIYKLGTKSTNTTLTASSFSSGKPGKPELRGFAKSVENVVNG
jgi:hypothetical protein